MLNNPWDAKPPSPDDPGPRFVRPIPADDLRRIFEPRTRRAIEAQFRPDLIEQLRQRANRKPSWMEEVAEFIADVRREPTHAAVCVCFGVVAGMLAVVVPALVIGAVL